ncbi:hypothetical protein AAIB33_11105 [Microbacterium sp. AZCO]|uniref:hypothetical protein n=1 Tax=Microbacterium sp. AZCO TaxID=3142976 RepID=UPI0031F393F7
MTMPETTPQPGDDSLGVDEELLDDDSPEATEVVSDDDATEGDVLADQVTDDGVETDEWGDPVTVADPEILSADPDEYSDTPHMGSVPRLLGEDEYQPDTQGEDPIYAELGEEGQGDLAPEDE